VKWDLAKLIAGAYGNVSQPFGLVEQGLRTNRTKILDEVRWRYREIRQLCAQLRFPPKDPKTRLFWQMRLEEYSQYIDALTHKKVVSIEDDLEEHDESQSND
jgi:DNA-directed RNA polymerase specialized sigma subunit